MGKKNCPIPEILRGQNSGYMTILFFVYCADFQPIKSGAGGIRTPVRIKCQYAFYMFIGELFVSDWQARSQPKPVPYSQSISLGCQDTQPHYANLV